MCTSPKPYSGLSVGPHTFDVKAADEAGNEDASAAHFEWTIVPPDSTPPTVTVSAPATPASGWFNAAYLAAHSGAVTINVSATDVSGVQSISCTDGVTSVSLTGETGAGTAAEPRTASFGLSSDGTHDITCTATDNSAANNSGNSGSGNTATVKIDASAPDVSCSPPDTTVWYDNNQTVPCSASDDASGLEVASDGTGFNLVTDVDAGEETSSASTGTHAVKDNAQNSSTAGPYVYKIDRRAPQLSSCDSADSAWHAANVTLKCHYTDGGSGPATLDVDLFTNVAAGNETASASASAGGAQACDAVDNCAATPADIGGNKIDRRAPQLSSCDSADSAWHAANVTLKCHYTDGGSGPATLDVDLFTNVAAGNETASASASAGGAQACDAVNNCAATPADIGGNKIDQRAPQLSSCDSADSSWHAANVTLQCHYTDGGSVPATLDVDLLTNVGAGNETASASASAGGAQACDAVSNCAATPADIGGNKIDRKAPSITLTTPPAGASYVLNQL